MYRFCCIGYGEKGSIIMIWWKVGFHPITFLDTFKLILWDSLNTPSNAECPYNWYETAYNKNGKNHRIFKNKDPEHKVKPFTITLKSFRIALTWVFMKNSLIFVQNVHYVWFWLVLILVATTLHLLIYIGRLVWIHVY